MNFIYVFALSTIYKSYNLADSSLIKSALLTLNKADIILKFKID